MTTVTNTINDPGEQPVKDATVRITLITGTNSPGYTSSGEVQGTYSLSTDQTGSWSANLTPNSLITPANTYYQVVEGRAVSTISMPASGGPYLLKDVLVTPPPTPGAPGITGLQVAVGGTVQGARPEINLIAGTNVTLTGADNPGSSRVDVTINATGGSGGGVQIGGDLGGTNSTPTVITTHLGSPLPLNQGGTNAADAAGARTSLGLGTAATQNTGAFDTAGAAATALTAAEANAAATYVPLTAEGTPGGVATLDGSGHLTTGQDANLLKTSQLGAANGAASLDSAGHLAAPQGANFLTAANIGAAGSGAGNALSANDPTTTNTRTPTAHAATHAVGGSDPLTPDAIGAITAGWTDMLGLALLTAPLVDSGFTVAQSPGDLVLFLCIAAKTKTVSTLGLQVTAAGVTGSGVNALALYTEAGVMIDQTGDMTAQFSSVGFAEGAMGGSHTVVAGTNYYLAVLTHFSGTQPHLAATGTTGSPNISVINGHYPAIFKSGQASLPASFTPSSYTINSGYYIAYAR